MSFITFQAPSADLSDGNGTLAYGLNSGGDCCGFYFDSDSNAHGFIRHADGTFTEFDVAGAGNTWPCCINDSGVVAGYYTDIHNTNPAGFIRAADGTITTFLVPGSTQTVIFTSRAIDSSGNVAGWYKNSGGDTHWFLRSAGGSFTTFDPLSGTRIAGFPDNDAWTYGFSGVCLAESGEMVAVADNSTFPYVQHGIKISGGIVTSSDAPGSGNPGTTFCSLNSTGFVGGYFYDTALGQYFGLVLHPDGTTYDTFQPTPGATDVCVTWVNDSGDAAGSYVDLSGTEYYRGFTRSAGGTIVVFDVPGAAMDYFDLGGSFVCSFNNGGEMAGYILADDGGGRLGLNYGFIGAPESGPPPPAPPLRYKRIPI